MEMQRWLVLHLVSNELFAQFCQNTSLQNVVSILWHDMRDYNSLYEDFESIPGVFVDLSETCEIES